MLVTVQWEGWPGPIEGGSGLLRLAEVVVGKSVLTRGFVGCFECTRMVLFFVKSSPTEKKAQILF